MCWQVWFNNNIKEASGVKKKVKSNSTSFFNIFILFLVKQAKIQDKTAVVVSKDKDAEQWMQETRCVV